VPDEVNSIKLGSFSYQNTSRNIRIAFSLFPSLSKNIENGTLEDLFLNNLKHPNASQALKDIQCFMNKLETGGRNFKWPHKSKLYTYFSIEDKFVSKKLGEAAKVNAFNFDCAAMNSFKQLLLDISR